jgi:hypothetical protein
MFLESSSATLSACLPSSFDMADQASRPYKRIVTIIFVLYFILALLDSKWKVKTDRTNGFRHFPALPVR